MAIFVGFPGMTILQVINEQFYRYGTHYFNHEKYS